MSTVITPSGYYRIFLIEVELIKEPVYLLGDSIICNMFTFTVHDWCDSNTVNLPLASAFLPFSGK